MVNWTHHKVWISRSQRYMRLMVVNEATGFINPLTVLIIEGMLLSDASECGVEDMHLWHKMFIIWKNTELLFGLSFHLSPPFSSPHGVSVGEHKHGEYPFVIGGIQPLLCLLENWVLLVIFCFLQASFVYYFAGLHFLLLFFCIILNWHLRIISGMLRFR